MNKKLVWEIHNTKLNKKNFWIPFWIFSIVFTLIYFFSTNFLDSIFSRNIESNYPLSLIISIISFPYLFIITSVIVFLIIRRLLSKKPKKVFYLELPILIIIYSLFYIFYPSTEILIGGLTGLKYLIFFITLWLSLLTISLYFYYKKFVSKNL